MTAAEQAEDTGIAEWASWMGAQVERAAGHWGLALNGAPAVGYQGRGSNAHSPAIGPDGARWIRVNVQFDERPAWPLYWLGNEAANAVTGLPKPQVLEVWEWRDHWEDCPCTVRSELMTFLPGRQVQDLDTREWTGIPPEGWWGELDAALAAIRATPVGPERRYRTAEEITADVWEMLGVNVEVRQWESAHGDLTWCNLLREPFGLVDWETWGMHPAGTGEAHLYVGALTFPELAAKTRERLAPVLDAEGGRVALLIEGARMVRWSQDGPGMVEMDALVPILRRLGARVPG